MDKNKSEKLKEILSQTLSTEDIEKKLKEEIKNNALKKEKIKEQENLDRNKQVDEKIEKKNDSSKKVELEKEVKQKKVDEDSVIPNIKEKKKDDKGLTILLYLVIIIAILLFSIVIYLFTNTEEKISNDTKIELAKEKTLNETNISKNLISVNNDKKENEEKVLVINPKIDEKIKNNETIEEEIAQTTKEEVESISNENKVLEATIEEKEPKEIVKAKETPEIREVIKEKIVTKTIRLDKKNFKEYYNSTKYNSLKCYNFKAGDIFPTEQCKSDLKEFLLANKKAIRFEVISVISEDDNIHFKKMESELKNMDKDFQIKVKEYMFKGLSRERVLETSWNIKNILGEDTILTPTNYYVKSKKNNKGVIIKAYH